MAYVTGFAHDVFISFTHDDNQPVSGPDGWVTLFERTLNALLPQRLPEKRKVDVWRDPRLSSNDLLGPTLDSTVSQTAVLVCVMSPRYLKADWCRRELAAFWESRHRGFTPKLNDSLRVFKVLLQDQEVIRQVEQELTDYPSELRDTLGKPFFDRDPPNQEFSQLVWPRGLNDADKRFLVRMERLADQIAKQLEIMRRKVDDEELTFDRLNTSRPLLGPIYLAEVTDDLADDCLKLKQELVRLGVRVLPDDSLSNKRTEAEQEIRRALGESQLAVHLFASTYGKPLKGENYSVPHLQYLLSREHAANTKKFGRLAWVADSVDRSKLAPAQRELLEQLENEPEGTAPIDFQSGSLQRFKESILKKLAKPPVRPKARKSKRAMIYVTGQPSDMAIPDTESLVMFLKREHDVMKSPTPEDDERLLKRHEKYCQQSDGLVLVYGTAPSDWVQDKAFDIRQLTERRREKPLAAAVYEAPPEKKDVLSIEFESVIKVDGSRGFDPDNLRPFLELVDQSDEPSSTS